MGLFHAPAVVAGVLVVALALLALAFLLSSPTGRDPGPEQRYWLERQLADWGLVRRDPMWHVRD